MPKSTMFDIFNGFVLGTIDISKLNFGVISLIPEVKGADSIKLYRLMALINIPFKIGAKAFSM